MMNSVFKDRHILFMGWFGFMAGLPLLLSGATLAQWLAEAQVPLSVIGLTASISLAYSFKFLWAPIFDGMSPVKGFGRRRGWLIVIQPLVALAIGGLAFSNPSTGYALAFSCAALIAFLSASQDIVIDAWRIESFSPERQAKALAAYIYGYRLGLLTAGSGVLLSVRYLGWSGALLSIALLFILSVPIVMIAPETDVVDLPVQNAPFNQRVLRAIVDPLREFLLRPGAKLILAYVALFYLDEVLAGKMLVPLYRHLGFSREVVGLAGPFQLCATLLGYAVGASLVARLGMARALITTGFTQTAFMAMYVALTVSHGNLHMLYATVIAEAFVQAMAVAAFVAYLSALCSLRFTATQYALLTSVAALASHTVGGFSGFAAEALGWTNFYLMAMFSAVPSMLLMLRILRRFPPQKLLAATETA